ncbi:MAG: OmpA family protein [Hyphomicrobiaceae bacterium]
MTRRTNGSKLLPLAMMLALAGTSWIGLAGSPAVPDAKAQRSQERDRDNRENEEQERRKRERQRQEQPQQRPADRAAPQRPEAPRSVQPEHRSLPGRDERERRDRAAPSPPLDQPRRAAPQPPPQLMPPQPPRPELGRTAPPPVGQRGEPPQQRQVMPPGDRERQEDDRLRRRGPEPARPVQQEPSSRDRFGTSPDRGRIGQPPEREPLRDGRSTEPPRFGAGEPARRDGDRPRERLQWSGPKRLDEVKRGRVERVEDGRRVIEEPGNRVIIREKDRIVIRRDEGRAFQRYNPNARTRDLSDGRRETWFERPDGTRVYTEVDRNGRILRRWRRDRSGREIVLIDNRRFYRDIGIGIGIGALGIGIGLALAPPPITIPLSKYIVEYEDASDDDLYEALSAPPLGRLERGYSLDEIRYSASLRDYMRRIDLDTINFEFGSFEVAPDQYPKLARLARIILRMLERNEAEVFLIEGHTDAVGSDEDNLTLSDRRAEAVADILVYEFGVPIENLVTQGYGEQYLKIQTQAPERQNRRVALRRITPLLGDFRDR